jgi:uncharacterized protein YjbI with pentapeptide repeats
VNWLFDHKTAEKVLFGLIAATVFIATMNGLWDYYLNGIVNPFVGVAAVAAVVVFFWGRHRQGGVVVDGKHAVDKGTREPRAVPKFAKKADDLEAIKKAVDDAASVSGGLWLSYLFVLFYLGVAAGAVTHADLFFEKAVKLPFLGIELPLVAFFFLAPILFVLAHAYTLVHLVMLTDKAKCYHQAIYAQIKDAETRDKLRRQLPSNIFIQFLAGPSDLRNSAFGRLLRSIGWISLVIAPALLLLMMQIQFLPYHSLSVTWTQRIALLFDLALIWWLWGTVVSGSERDATAPIGAAGTGATRGAAAGANTTTAGASTNSGLSTGALGDSTAGGSDGTGPSGKGDFGVERRSPRDTATTGRNAEQPRGAPIRNAPGRDRATAAVVAVVIGLFFSVLAVAFSYEIATFPGERQEKLYRPMWVVAVHNALFSAEPDDYTHRRFPFSNTLVLPGLNVYEGLGIDDPEKAKGRDFVFHPRGRDLREAIFTFASLPRVDFTGANLQGARFPNAQLQGASLNNAHLQGASLDLAQLQGASLELAQLQGASLDRAQLQGASLNAAYLQGANFRGAELQSASLTSADLQGANLSGARLQGASLNRAHLQVALFIGAQLQGVSFSGATLKATNLSSAYLWRSNQADIPEGISRADVPANTRADIPAVLSAIRMGEDDKEDDKRWQPWWQDSNQQVRLWDDKDYNNLRTRLQSLLPPGRLRDAALKRIEVLDCSSPDKTLQSCNPASDPPTEATTWRKAVAMNKARGVRAYRAALAESLTALFCPGDENEAWVVRAVVSPKFGQLQQAGSDARGLIAKLLNKNSSDCPVAASLTGEDRETLFGIKQEIESAEEPTLPNPRQNAPL